MCTRSVSKSALFEGGRRPAIHDPPPQSFEASHVLLYLQSRRKSMFWVSFAVETIGASTPGIGFPRYACRNRRFLKSFILGVSARSVSRFAVSDASWDLQTTLGSDLGRGSMEKAVAQS